MRPQLGRYRGAGKRPAMIVRYQLRSVLSRFSKNINHCGAMKI